MHIENDHKWNPWVIATYIRLCKQQATCLILCACPDKCKIALDYLVNTMCKFVVKVVLKNKSNYFLASNVAYFICKILFDHTGIPFLVKKGLYFVLVFCVSCQHVIAICIYLEQIEILYKSYNKPEKSLNKHKMDKYKLILMKEFTDNKSTIVEIGSLILLAGFMYIQLSESMMHDCEASINLTPEQCLKTVSIHVSGLMFLKNEG